MIRPLAVLIILAAAPPGADPNSATAQWFHSLKSNKGTNCCDVADCRHPYAWRLTDRYQIMITNDGQWVDVPEETILRRDNPTGDAVACTVGHSVRCFVPPPET